LDGGTETVVSCKKEAALSLGLNPPPLGRSGERRGLAQEAHTIRIFQGLYPQREWGRRVRKGSTRSTYVYQGDVNPKRKAETRHQGKKHERSAVNTCRNERGKVRRISKKAAPSPFRPEKKTQGKKRRTVAVKKGKEEDFKVVREK